MCGRLDAFHNKFYALSNFNTVKNEIFQSPFKRVNSLKHWLFTIFMGQPVRLTVWANSTQKFRTGKFRLRIAAFTFCAIHFHLSENSRECLKVVSKMA